MAETVTAPTNINVKFQGKPTREPPAPGIKKKAKKLLQRGMISQKQHDKLAEPTT